MFEEDLTEEERILLGPTQPQTHAAVDDEATVPGHILMRRLGHISAKRIHAFLANKHTDTKDDRVVDAWRAVHPEFRLCCDMRRWRILRKELLLQSYNYDATWPPTIENSEYFGDERWTLCVISVRSHRISHEMWWFQRNSPHHDPLRGIRLVFTFTHRCERAAFSYVIDRLSSLRGIRQICIPLLSLFTDTIRSLSVLEHELKYVKCVLVGEDTTARSNSYRWRDFGAAELLHATKYIGVESIGVIGSTITQEAADALLKMSTLRHLQLIKSVVPVSSSIFSINGLETLRLVQTDISFSSISLCPPNLSIKAVSIEKPVETNLQTLLLTLPTVAPNLTFLSTALCSFNQLNFNYIGQLKNLRELRMQNHQISVNSALPMLKSCELLETLLVDGGGVIRDLSFLNSCTKLTTLELVRVVLDPAAFSTARIPTKIRKLSLNSSTGVCLSNALGLFSDVEDFNASNTDITTASGSTLSSFHKMRTINISNCTKLTDYSILDSCTALRYVYMAGCTITLTQVRQFFNTHPGHCEMLVNIEVFSSELVIFSICPYATTKSNFWKSIAHNFQTKESKANASAIRIDRGFIEEMDAWLDSCKNCEELHFTAPMQASKIPFFLTSFANVKSIRFGKSVSPAALQAVLVHLHEVSAIDVHDTNLGECILSSLHLFPKLQKLDLSDCTNLKSFAHLKKCTQLSKLALTNTDCLALDILEYTSNCTRLNVIRVSPESCCDINMILDHAYPQHLRNRQRDNVFEALLEAIRAPQVAIDSEFNLLLQKAIVLCRSSVVMNIDCSGSEIKDLSRVVTCFSATVKQCTITGYTGTLASFPMTNLVELHLTSSIELAQRCLKSQSSSETLRAFSFFNITHAENRSTFSGSRARVPRSLSFYRFSRLEYLCITGSNEVLFDKPLASASCLRVLELKTVQISICILSELTAFGCLESFSIEGCTGVTSLTGLNQCVSLKQLNVSNTNVSLKDCITSVHPFAALPQLRIQAKQCTETLSAMAAMSGRWSPSAYWQTVLSQWRLSKLPETLTIEADALAVLRNFSAPCERMITLRIGSPVKTVAHSLSALLYFPNIVELEIFTDGSIKCYKDLQLCQRLRTVSIHFGSIPSLESDAFRLSTLTEKLKNVVSLVLAFSSTIEELKLFKSTTNLARVEGQRIVLPSRLTRLELHGCIILHSMEYFASLTALQCLELCDCDLSNVRGGFLTHLRNLVSLSLEGCIIDHDLSELQNLTSLRHLNISRTNIDLNTCLQHTKKNTSLVNIRINSLQCSDFLTLMGHLKLPLFYGKFWENVYASWRVRQDDIALDIDKDVLVKLQSALEKLGSMIFVVITVNSETPSNDLSYFSFFEKMQYLSLTIVSALTNIKPLLLSRRLTTLTIHSLVNPERLLKTLSGHHSLETLSIYTNGCTGSLAALQRFPKLTKLTLHNANITSRGLEEISCIPHLTSLSLDECTLPSPIPELFSCETLTSLAVRRCACQGGDVVQLATTFVNLSELDLTKCSGVSNIEPLVKCSKLRSLSVVGTDVTLTAVRSLWLRVALSTVVLMMSNCTEEICFMALCAVFLDPSRYWLPVVAKASTTSTDTQIIVPESALQEFNQLCNYVIGTCDEPHRSHST